MKNYLNYLKLSEVSVTFKALVSGSQEFCVNAPLPAIPTGTVQEARLSDFFGDTFDIKVWRVGCSDTNSNVLIRIEPVNESPFICSISFTVIQNNDQFDVKLTDKPGGFSFCDDLFVSKTFLMEQWSFEISFNDDAAFTLIWEDDPDNRLNIESFAGQQAGCAQGGIATFSPENSIANIPAVELPSGECFNVQMQRIAPFENFNFTVINAIPIQ